MSAPAARTDVHRPSAPEFDPSAYICLGVYDMNHEFGNWPLHAERVAQVRRSVGATFDDAPHPQRQCSHCGQYLRYVALMVHHDSNTLMHIGETCLDERFSAETHEEFAALRAAAAAKSAATREANRRHDIAAEITEWLAGQDERLAELTYRDNGGLLDDNDFLSDVAYKMFRYGNLSQRQVDAVLAAVTRDAARNGRTDERDAADAERKANATPAPAGRIEVAGTVEHTWWKEGDYGMAAKMRLAADGGYLVVSTVPAALVEQVTTLDELRGRAVAFTATLKPSHEDDTLAFASRPTKARLA